jgi:hypothetical protein
MSEMKKDMFQILISSNNKVSGSNQFLGWLKGIGASERVFYGVQMPKMPETKACPKMIRRRKSAIQFQYQRKAEHLPLG